MTKTAMTAKCAPAALLAALSLAGLLAGGCANHQNEATGPGKAPPAGYGQQHAAGIAQYEQSKAAQPGAPR